jgi:hypothetical protein
LVHGLMAFHPVMRIRRPEPLRIFLLAENVARSP